MNIFINARFLSQSLTGVQRYATEFVKALDYLIETGQIDDT
ncbi:MAG: glycosyltransferase family 1 protein, partial [Candidatus Parabeggiatoa sp. nov. 1]